MQFDSVRARRLLSVLFLVTIGLAPSIADAKPTEAAKKASIKKERERAKAKAAPEATPTTTSEEGRALQRGERVEFDGRLIQGQTAKAGAVYLFARVATDSKSMVKERHSFREEILQSVFPGSVRRDVGPPAGVPQAIKRAPQKKNDAKKDDAKKEDAKEGG